MEGWETWRERLSHASDAIIVKDLSSLVKPGLVVCKADDSLRLRLLPRNFSIKKPAFCTEGKMENGGGFLRVFSFSFFPPSLSLSTGFHVLLSLSFRWRIRSCDFLTLY